MKKYFLILLGVLSISTSLLAQTDVAVAKSSWKKVNTLSFFEKTTNTISSTPIAFIAPTGEEKIIYFDKQNNQTSQNNASYYRKAKFQENGGLKDIVQDYYINNRPKFKGGFATYNAIDENKNNIFQGECEFYAEDGSKTIRKYTNGQYSEEKRILPNGIQVSETILNPNKTKKYFEENVFDEKGNKTATIQGRYNPVTKIDESRKTIFGTNNQVIATIDFAENCPKSKVKYFNVNGDEYDAYLQDFSCEPNNEWRFINAELFDKYHNAEQKNFQIKSLQAGNGFLVLPVSNEFQKKTFEIVASFEKKSTKTTNEFGIVWQFQDKDNYAYFVINLIKKTFEINAKANGEIKKYMVGIRPQTNIDDTQTTYTLALQADPTNNKFSYSINGSPISYGKFPSILTKDSKSWNIGYIVNAQNESESINLKKIEIKLF